MNRALFSVVAMTIMLAGCPDDPPEADMSAGGPSRAAEDMTTTDAKCEPVDSLVGEWKVYKIAKPGTHLEIDDHYEIEKRVKDGKTQYWYTPYKVITNKDTWKDHAGESYEMTQFANEQGCDSLCVTLDLANHEGRKKLHAFAYTPKPKTWRAGVASEDKFTDVHSNHIGADACSAIFTLEGDGGDVHGGRAHSHPWD